MSQARCGICRATVWVAEDEELRESTARCSNCGEVGSLKCAHARTATDGCVDCGMDFSEAPDEFENDSDDL